MPPKAGFLWKAFDNLWLDKLYNIIYKFVIYKVDNFSCSVLNVSSVGIFLSLLFPMPRGAKHTLLPFLISRKPWKKGVLKVRWIKKCKHKPETR